MYGRASGDFRAPCARPLTTAFYGRRASPVERDLHVVLANRLALEVAVGERVGRPRGLGEEALHVRRPGPGIDRVQQFLFGKFLPGDVDRLKPLQLLVVPALAEIDSQPVVENPVLSLCREVREVAEEVVELPGDVFRVNDLLALMLC